MSNVNPNSERWSYEETVASVEEIIDQIESGSLPLEEVFEQFAIAVDRLRQCEAFLSQGKEQMHLLIETLTDDLEVEVDEEF